MREVLCEVREDVCLAMAFLPLWSLDFRAPVSSMLTASDASENGNGVCSSTGLTSCGVEALSELSRPRCGLDLDRLILPVGLFDGIGGLMQAFEKPGCSHCRLRVC